MEFSLLCFNAAIITMSLSSGAAGALWALLLELKSWVHASERAQCSESEEFILLSETLSELLIAKGTVTAWPTGTTADFNCPHAGRVTAGRVELVRRRGWGLRPVCVGLRSSFKVVFPAIFFSRLSCFQPALAT